MQANLEADNAAVTGDASARVGVRRRAFYLRVSPDPVFAVAHLPPRPGTDATGVVMCPSFGWEDHCIHRTKRTWADALSDAGHPVIRIDLPGTGDSGGSARDPERLAAWTAAVAGAAAWLRAEAGCTRVAGFGIGLGGMLAWAAATQDAAIDDLILWATPTSGRRLLREMRAAAAMSIDSSLKFESAAEVEICEAATDLGDDLLDEAGQITTRATIDSLSGLDLTAVPVADPSARRVLLFMRSGNEADEALESYFRNLGAEVTAGDGDGYSAMMQYVQQSALPERAVAQSLAWLDAVPATTKSPLPGIPKAGTSDDLAADVLDLSQDGVAVTERPISLAVGGQVLSGIVTEPVGASAQGVCAVFFSGGSDRRIGPNRMWVETARRWAARGVHAVRIDPPGIGDSDGDERDWDRLSQHYEPRKTEWALELLDALHAEGLPDRFVLSGFCAGGYRSFHVAMADNRVVGTFAIGLPFFFWTWWTLNVRDWWTVDWVPTSTDTWKKTTVVRAIQRVIAVAIYVRRAAMRLTRHGPDRTERALRDVAGNGTEILILLKAGSHELRDMVADGRIRRLRDIPRVEILRIPGHDMRFRPLALQHHINTAMDRALERVLRNSGQADKPPVLTGCGQVGYAPPTQNVNA